jgi:hypothetical protein
MFTWLSRLVTRGRETAPEALRAFLARQSAYVTQKTVLDYCRVKAGRHEREMFADADFQLALRHCRWQTFAGAAQDLTAMAEAWLRPHAAGREAALAAALTDMAARILDEAPVPAEERESLEGAKAALGRHLALLQDAPPHSADRLPLLAEAPLLATLPIHADQRIGETPSIRGALRFHIVSSQQEMERVFDAPALVTNMLQR